MDWGRAFDTVWVSAVTALITTLITLWLSRRAAKREEANSELAERLNRDKNVVRYGETSQTSFGVIDKTTWFVNPFWIHQSGDLLQVREYPNYALLDTKEVVKDRRVTGTRSEPLAWNRVLEARENREWIVFRDNWKNGLVYFTHKPCTYEDGHLFQELPTPRKILGFLPRRKSLQ